MIYKQIGNDKVSAIGIGTYGIYKDEHVDSIKYAVDCGINFIDTAEEYNDGDSEIIIGRAIKHIRKDIFLSTKVSPENLNYYDVLKSCCLSLKRLNTDYIDLYNIHWPNSSIDIKRTLNAMQSLIKHGKIRYVGVSNFTYKQLVEAHDILGNSLVSIQNEYSPIERTVEDEILPFCEDNGIMLIAYSPYKFASYINLSGNPIVLSWIVSHSNTIALVKSTNKEHIKVNCEKLEYTKEVLPNKECAYIPISSICDFKKSTDYSPTPEDLAYDIKRYGLLKPLKVKFIDNKYEIVEGKLRFLAWCIANKNKDIPAIILNNHDVPKT